MSEGKFTQVDGHPTWVILGQTAYNTALTLSILEAAFESALFIAELTSNGSGIASAVTTPVAIGIAIAAFLVSGLIKAGERR